MNCVVVFGGVCFDWCVARAFDASRVVSLEFEMTRNVYVEDFLYLCVLMVEVSVSMVYKMVG